MTAPAHETQAPVQAGQHTVTRIDFHQTLLGWQVNKFSGDAALYIGRGITNHPIAWDLRAALQWCRDNGYTVHEWPGGARAWLGEPQPVRTMKSALRLLENAPETWPVEKLDLMYDG